MDRNIAVKSLGPRITLATIEENIVSEHYFTAGDGVHGAVDHPKALDLLTFCVLVMRNGFTVTGESACASPENFDADIGRHVARSSAIEKCWPLMGYELRTRLAQEPAKGGGAVLDSTLTAALLPIDAPLGVSSNLELANEAQLHQKLPSRFQVGDDVSRPGFDGVVWTVEGVQFTDGKVHYILNEGELVDSCFVEPA